MIRKTYFCEKNGQITPRAPSNTSGCGFLRSPQRCVESTLTGQARPGLFRPTTRKIYVPLLIFLLIREQWLTYHCLAGEWPLLAESHVCRLLGGLYWRQGRFAEAEKLLVTEKYKQLKADWSHSYSWLSAFSPARRIGSEGV